MEQWLGRDQDTKKKLFSDSRIIRLTYCFFDSIGKPIHPTEKPLELFEYLIKTYTNEGDTVLDNCMGSGTTGVACKNLNRNFIGIEIGKEYFQIAKKRIEEAFSEEEFKLF